MCSANFTEVCSSGCLLCDFSPLSPQNVLFISLTHNFFSLLLPYPNCILFTLLYKTTLLSLPYLVSWTYFCTFKALWTGNHIIYLPNYDTCESERGPNNNFAGTTGIHQESPQQTRAHDHHTSLLKQRAVVSRTCPLSTQKRRQRLGNCRFLPTIAFPLLSLWVDGVPGYVSSYWCKPGTILSR